MTSKALEEIVHLPTLAACTNTTELIAVLKDLPQADIPIDHKFTPGLYTRTMRAPVGCLIVGKIHKISSLNILISGTISISENGSDAIVYEAPCMWESPSGSQKTGLVLSDVVMTVVSPTGCTDVDSVEREIFYSDETKLEEIR